MSLAFILLFKKNLLLSKYGIPQNVSVSIVHFAQVFSKFYVKHMHNSFVISDFQTE